MTKVFCGSFRQMTEGKQEYWKSTLEELALLTSYDLILRKYIWIWWALVTKSKREWLFERRPDNKGVYERPPMFSSELHLTRSGYLQAPATGSGEATARRHGLLERRPSGNLLLPGTCAQKTLARGPPQYIPCRVMELILRVVCARAPTREITFYLEVTEGALDWCREVLY